MKLKHSKASAGTTTSKHHLIPLNVYSKIFTLLEAIPLTANRVLNIYRGYSGMSIFTDIDLVINTVKTFFILFLMQIMFVVLGIILFKNIVAIVLCILMASVVTQQLFRSRIIKMHNKLLLEEKEALTLLRQEFQRTHDVVEALSNIRTGKLIERPLAIIIDALQSLDTEERLEVFRRSCPLKTLYTLADVCSLIQEQGDSKLANGESNFLNAISMITQEVNLEIRKNALQKQEFGIISMLPVVSLVALPILRIALSSAISGVSVVYSSSLGTYVTCICILIAFICYSLINQMMMPSYISYNDTSTLDHWLKNADDFPFKYVKNFLEFIKPSDLKTYRKKIDIINDSMTQMNLDDLYMKKMRYTILSMISTALAIVIINISGYYYAYNNIEVMSAMAATEYSDAQRELITQMDKEYFTGEYIADDEELKKYIRKHIKVSSDSVLTEQVNRIRDKEKNLGSFKFSIVYVWIVIAVGIIANKIPEILLKRRTKLIKNESEEDCLQLQTLIGILMNTNIDTLDLLDRFQKNSQVFRGILLEAYHNYPSGGEEALQVLKMKAALPDFKYMVDKLELTIHQLTIAEAFSDISSERIHLLSLRETAQMHSIKRKRSMISPIAMAPMITVLFGYLGTPIGFLFYKDITNFMASYGSLF